MKEENEINLWGYQPEVILEVTSDLIGASSINRLRRSIFEMLLYCDCAKLDENIKQDVLSIQDFLSKLDYYQVEKREVHQAPFKN